MFFIPTKRTCSDDNWTAKKCNHIRTWYPCVVNVLDHIVSSLFVESKRSQWWVVLSDIYSYIFVVGVDSQSLTKRRREMCFEWDVCVAICCLKSRNHILINILNKIVYIWVQTMKLLIIKAIVFKCRLSIEFKIPRHNAFLITFWRIASEKKEIGGIRMKYSTPKTT